MNFDLIEKADISQQDFADIIGISRMSLAKLIHNGNIEKLERGLAMLATLIATNKLPRGYGREDKESRAALVQKLKDRFEILA